jgi:hypothetical protein
MHPEGPATGHLDKRFLDFPLSSSKCRDGPQDSKLLPHAALPLYIYQINPLALE